MNKQYRVEIEGNCKTLQFAATELRRCLDLLPDQKGNGCIRLSVVCDSDTHPYDDAISIDVTAGAGTITGPNPRSVLIGVYRYLQELGCQFLFPGKTGEVFPQTICLPGSKVKIEDRPRNRYRGICIEGSNRVETLLDVIDFLPKLGFNCYFTQFQQSHTFFKWWYRHTRHPELEDSTPYPIEEAEKNLSRVVEEITKRDLIYHAVGHGWTCEPFGIPGLGWEAWTEDIPDETKQYFALVNGKRDLWDGVPLNTSLCFSNPNCRKIVVDSVIAYAYEHRNVDIIHLWLADAFNNQCECLGCSQNIPTDWYLILLNEIDAALAEQGIDTKICFLIYQELLWPPEKEKLVNPDRFVLMFAPISRTYYKSFSSNEEGVIAPFVLNHIALPESVADNVAHLQAWKQFFDGDGFLYDYHYMWAHHRDAGGYQIAGVLYDDLVNLPKLGLNGLVSCQVQRAMFPNALGITVMAKALWGGESFEEIACKYMASLYGVYAGYIGEYLKELSALSTDLDLEHPKNIDIKKSQIAERIIEITAEMIESVEHTDFSMLPIANTFLCAHAKLWNALGKVLMHMHRGEEDLKNKAWDDARRILWQMEDETEMGLDCFNFDRTFHKIFE